MLRQSYGQQVSAYGYTLHASRRLCRNISMSFNPRAAKLMQPGQHQLVDGCPGLRLVCNATRKTWTYRFEVDGRMKQKAFGQWPAMSLADAMSKWEALRCADPEKQDSTYTVRQMIDAYVSGHLVPSRTEASATAATRILDTVARDIGGLAASAVGRSVAFDLLDSRKDTPTMATKIRSLMAAATDYALDAGRIPEETPNRWRDVMRGKLKSKGKIMGGEHVGQQRRALNASEVGDLIRWSENMHDLGVDATIMYLWTCARGSEILAMRPEYITQEADGWWWTVPKKLTKNAASPHAVDLRVPLVGRALEIAQSRMGGEWLFLNGRSHYEQKEYSTYIYSLQPYATKEAGGLTRLERGLECIPVANWTPHNLRRTSRTLLSVLGCRDEIGEAILGHLPKDIVGTYNVNTYDKERREWLTKLSLHLDQLGSFPGVGS